MGFLRELYGGLALVALAGCSHIPSMRDVPKEQYARDRVDEYLQQSQVDIASSKTFQRELSIYETPWESSNSFGQRRLLYHFRNIQGAKIEADLRSRYPEMKDLSVIEETNVLSAVFPYAPPEGTQSDYISDDEQNFRRDVEFLDELKPRVGVKITAIKRFGDLTFDRRVEATIKDLSEQESTVIPIANLLFPGAELREPLRNTFGGDYGILYKDSRARYEHAISLLVSEGFVEEELGFVGQVDSGKTIRVSSDQEIPFNRVVLSGGGKEEEVAYKKIPTFFELTPELRQGNRLFVTFTSSIGGLTPQGTTQTDKIDSEEARVEGVTLRGNEDTLFAGKFREREQNVSRATPGLDSLPLIGKLFSGRDYWKSNQRTLYYIQWDVLDSNSSHPAFTEE